MYLLRLSTDILLQPSSSCKLSESRAILILTISIETLYFCVPLSSKSLGVASGFAETLDRMLPESKPIVVATDLGIADMLVGDSDRSEQTNYAREL